MMMNTFRNRAQKMSAPALRVLLVCSMALAVAACGKDSDDGDVVTTIALPTDSVLNLYCEDFGLFTETCVLDDPDNPYARVNVNNENKFDLGGAAPSPKARVYLWATAQARFPDGENQWYVARSLHELYTQTVADFPPDGSLVIRQQTIRAYRSLLDNYFDSVTFFEAGFLPAPPPGGIFYPLKLRELTAQDLALTPTGFTPLFDTVDAGNNDFLARNTLGGWGYTWVGMIEGGGGGFQIPGPITRNF